MSVDYRYDGTFPGLLSVVFEIYASGNPPSSIRPDHIKGDDLFSNIHFIHTNNAQSERVLGGLKKKLSNTAISRLYKTMLSEAPNAEIMIYQMAKHALESNCNIESDFSQKCVLAVKKLAYQVDREVHRMHAFVRFQKTKDDIYAATIEPDFNVIPLLGDHFEKRYADQKWLIYDVKRNYGIFYDLTSTAEVKLNYSSINPDKQIPVEILSDDEDDFRRLWKLYFNATNIPERKNRKLHLQHMPKRYWKYLIEKEE